MSADQFLKGSESNVGNVGTHGLREDSLKSTDITDITKGGKYFKNTLSPSSLSHMVDSFLPQFTQQIAFIECDVSLMSRGEIGNAGEAYAYSEFERAGYAVTRTGHRDKEGDLRVLDTGTGEVWRVEVKSMRRDSRGHYQACLRRQIKARVCTDAAHSQVVLLLAFPKVGAPIPFLIPQAVLMGRSQIVISSDPRTYAGKWAKFRTLDGLRIPNGEEDSSYG